MKKTTRRRFITYCNAGWGGLQRFSTDFCENAVKKKIEAVVAIPTVLAAGGRRRETLSERRGGAP